MPIGWSKCRGLMHRVRPALVVPGPPPAALSRACRNEQSALLDPVN